MLSIIFGIFFISFQSCSSPHSFKEAEKSTQKALAVPERLWDYIRYELSKRK